MPQDRWWWSRDRLGGFVHKFAAWLLIAFGLLVLVGGVIGLVNRYLDDEPLVNPLWLVAMALAGVAVHVGIRHLRPGASPGA